MRTSLTILLTLWLIYGCAVGPDYQRPAYPVPDNFRGQGPDIPTQPAEASFGDLKWFEVFKDDKLQELIKIALKENYDVQIAAQRVLQAREQVIIQRSFLFPSVNANGQTETTRTSTRGFTPFTVTLRERMAGIVFGDLSWETRLLRPHPPGYRSRPGRVFRLRREPQLRHPDSGDRPGPGLYRAQGPGPAAGDQQPHREGPGRIPQAGEGALRLWLGFPDTRAHDGKSGLWGPGRGSRPEAGHRTERKPDQRLDWGGTRDPSPGVSLCWSRI